MTLPEIIEQLVIALYGNELVKNTLILKGGTALNLSEKLQKRLSKDVDFSVPGEVPNPEAFFNEVETVLKAHFINLGFELFDFKFEKRPKKLKNDGPRLWGGYEASFKLIHRKHGFENLEDRRRNALLPSGASSTKIRLDISEHEYCDLIKEVSIRNVNVKVYQPALLVLEKLRAICQQHPNYPHTVSRSRARDFFDIYELLKKHRSDVFHKLLRDHLAKVFNAKNVGLDLLGEIFEPDFLQLQEDGFKELINTGDLESLESFDFYIEQLKFLVVELR